MGICDYCGENASGVDFWHCKYCGRQFCTKHRLPEGHKCVGNPQNPHWGYGFHPNREPPKHRNIGMVYEPKNIIEKDSRPFRKRRFNHFREGRRICSGTDLKYFIFIVAFFAMAYLIVTNFDKIATYFQPEEIEKEEIEQPTLPKEDITRVPGKTMLVPVEGQSCQEIFSQPDKTKIVKSLCSALCETKKGEFLGQSSCMGDKKLYCKCQLYEEIITPKEVHQPEEVVKEEPEIQEPSDLKSLPQNKMIDL